MLFLVRHCSTYAGGSGCEEAVARSSAMPDLGLCKATRDWGQKLDSDTYEQQRDAR
jgi:hypothetical protein